MATNYSPKISTKDLVLGLDAGNTKSYPGVGTIWHDLSGNQNHGTLVNSPTYSTNNGGLFDFDGANSRINFTRIQYLASEEWTVTFIINRKADSATSWNGIFGGNIGSGGYWFFHGGSRLAWYETVINGIGYLWYSSPSFGNTFFADTYVHTTIRHSGDGVFDIYINGAYRTGTVRSLYTNYSLDFLSIGVGGGSRYGDTKISFFTIHNRALSPSEIQQNFNATRGRYGI